MLGSFKETFMNNKVGKFVELAEKRMNRAIKDLRLIGNLSNKNNYSYTDMQANKMLVALEQELKALKARFSTKRSDTDGTFKL